MKTHYEVYKSTTFPGKWRIFRHMTGNTNFLPEMFDSEHEAEDALLIHILTNGLV